MIGLATVALCAILNRMRGDDRWLMGLPGRALWYVAPMVGLVALLSVPPLAAVAVALAYAVWAIPSWGRWYDLGRLPEHRGPSAFEAAVEVLAGRHDRLALFIRFLVMLAPGLYLVGLALGAPWLGLAAVPMAILLLLSYDAGWQWGGWYAIPLAEVLAGAVWGGFIAAI